MQLFSLPDEISVASTTRAWLLDVSTEPVKLLVQKQHKGASPIRRQNTLKSVVLQEINSYMNY